MSQLKTGNSVGAESLTNEDMRRKNTSKVFDMYHLHDQKNPDPLVINQISLHPLSIYVK